MFQYTVLVVLDGLHYEPKQCRLRDWVSSRPPRHPSVRHRREARHVLKYHDKALLQDKVLGRMLYVWIPRQRDTRFDPVWKA